uniref:Uncharacterized protein n=1 Tax=Opuntia streptacantha TaxID=393608 RepID=A0A7C9DEJ7_OPUST
MDRGFKIQGPPACPPASFLLSQNLPCPFLPQVWPKVSALSSWPAPFARALTTRFGKSRIGCNAIHEPCRCLTSFGASQLGSLARSAALAMKLVIWGTPFMLRSWVVLHFRIRALFNETPTLACKFHFCLEMQFGVFQLPGWTAHFRAALVTGSQHSLPCKPGALVPFSLLLSISSMTFYAFNGVGCVIGGWIFRRLVCLLKDQSPLVFLFSYYYALLIGSVYPCWLYLLFTTASLWSNLARHFVLICVMWWMHVLVCSSGISANVWSVNSEVPLWPLWLICLHILVSVMF